MGCLKKAIYCQQNGALYNPQQVVTAETNNQGEDWLTLHSFPWLAPQGATMKMRRDSLDQDME